MRGRSLLFAFGLFVCSAVSAQQGCPPMQVAPPDPGKLLFTAKQEMELGELIRQQLESEFLVVDDPEVTAYLERIGDRVASHLPDVGLRYHFLLYDRPEIQAFGMPGGRIYVSRKMIAFLRSEDELAGVLGHEMGHLTARQQSVEISAAFREVLGLKTVPENEDLFELYNQFLDSQQLKKHHSESNGENKEQSIADQIGVEAVVRAGYSPQAFPDALDRILETKGKTGNWLSDLVGATKTNSRRLREALKVVASLPPACVEAASASRGEDFQHWQDAVLRYKGIGHAERIPEPLLRKTLSNPLRGDIEHFRFSPDGKYLLAQDESGIYVLSRDPFKFIFRIDSVDAQPAQFSSDSKQIVFFSSHLRVETWDVDRQEQISLTDVPALHGCRESALSPDAKFLACFDETLALALFDVHTGETLFQKDHFFDLDDGLNYFAGFYKLIYFLAHPEVVVLRFSPDARYFAASSRTGETMLFDLTARKKMNIPGGIHTAMGYSFAFVTNDRIVGIDSFSPQKSPVVEFPSGKVLDHAPLGGGSLVAATNPKYILLRPVTDYPVGGYDLEAKKIVIANRSSAMDIWGDFAAGERLNGEIGLYKIGETKAISITQLPLGRLASLQSFTASPDLKFLAIANHTRGGLWNLDTNTRVMHVRAFQNSYFTPNTTFFLDFPKFEKLEREMAVASPVTGQSKSRPVEKDDDITFFGDVLFRSKRADKNKNKLGRRNFELDALDIVDQKPLWSLNFEKGGPRLAGSPNSGILIFNWGANSDGIRSELERNPHLQSLWDKQKPGANDYILEALNNRTGAPLGAAIIRTGNWSFAPESIEAMGDWLVVGDNRNRVLLFSISTGEEKARWFGYRPQLSRNGQRLSLSNGRGHLVVYDLQNLKLVQDLYFGSSVSAHAWSADGSKLFVLTNDQTAFEFAFPSEAAKSARNN